MNDSTMPAVDAAAAAVVNNNSDDPSSAAVVAAAAAPSTPSALEHVPTPTLPPIDDLPGLSPLPTNALPLVVPPPPAQAQAAADNDEELFAISPIPKKNPNGTAQCMALHCTKNVQGKTKVANIGGFCRLHYNAWLIHTGQIESWTCLCGIKVSVELDRCGQCHRWMSGKRRPPVPGGVGASSSSSTSSPQQAKRARVDTTASATDAAASASANKATKTAVAATTTITNIELSNIRRVSERGRTLCKVVGCMKLDQTRNDGFCRKHYRMLSSRARGGGEESGGAADNTMNNTNGTNTVGGLTAAAVEEEIFMEDWTCTCGREISAKQKRCGKCNKWRGGKRDPYKSHLKFYEERQVAHAARVAAAASGSRGRSTTTTTTAINRINRNTVQVIQNIQLNVTDDSQHWTCPCGNVVPFNKSRCGKCHHWHNGKRKGGWTIKAFKSAEEDTSGIEWTQDWTCCDELISAKKRRCGKCNGWRGGKRIAKDSVIVPAPLALSLPPPPPPPMEDTTEAERGVMI